LVLYQMATQFCASQHGVGQCTVLQQSSLHVGGVACPLVVADVVDRAGLLQRDLSVFLPAADRIVMAGYVVPPVQFATERPLILAALGRTDGVAPLRSIVPGTRSPGTLLIILGGAVAPLALVAYLVARRRNASPG
jgi:hypothetical protein